MTTTVFLLHFIIPSVYCLQFSSELYTAVIYPNTAIGSVVQRVYAIGPSKVTFAIELNDYLSIDRESGRLSLSVSYSDISSNTNDSPLELVVTARASNELPVSSRVILLIKENNDCVCVAPSINVTVTENSKKQELAWLNLPPACPYRYIVNGSSDLSIEGDTLILQTLNYERTDGVIQASLSCGPSQTPISVSVVDVDDTGLYIPSRGSVRSHYSVINKEVDPDQIQTIQGMELKKLVVADDSGEIKNITLVKINDSLNLLTIDHDSHLIVDHHRNGRRKFYGTTVYWAKKLDIRESATIDVVAISENGPNVTWRFNIAYVDYDEFNLMNLSSIYNVTVSRSAASYQQVLQIKGSFSHSLHFSLHAENLHCAPFLNVTKHQGIVFVSDTQALNSSCEQLDSRYILSVSQGSRRHEAMLNARLLPPAVNAYQVHPTGTCAAASNPDACVNMSAAGTERCHWKRVGDSYSTCVPNLSCGDGVCDQLEGMVPDLCPQDCFGSWLGDHKSQCGRDRGICIAKGVCFCEGSNTKLYCLCQNSTEFGLDDDEDYDGYEWGSGARPVHEPYENDSDYLQNSICGLECVISIIVGAVLTMILLFALLLIYYKKNIKRQQGSGINAWRVNGNNLNFNFTSCPDYEGATPTTIVSTLSDWPDSHQYNNTGSLELFDEKWELSRQNLIIESYIGEGEFGRVVKAKYKPHNTTKWEQVAVKMLKDGACRSEFMDLLSEYTLLKEVDHPNVIRLIGAATASGPFHLVVEYCEHGSLKTYLKQIRIKEPTYVNDDTDFFIEHAARLLSFCWQISKGMQYLSDIKLVHRDLAARNILIATDMLVKISDFGMTKDVYEEDAYKKKGQGRIPVKWMAPESLYHQIYTSKSDVWSFGVVLWEIATLGATPYPGIPAERMYQLLHDGYRMDRPETCSLQLYHLMRQCWDYEPTARPNFKELKFQLDKMKQDEANYLNLAVCHKVEHIVQGSDEDLSGRQLTVALLPEPEQKFVGDYLVSITDQQRKHRYTDLATEGRGTVEVRGTAEGCSASEGRGTEGCLLEEMAALEDPDGSDMWGDEETALTSLV